MSRRDESPTTAGDSRSCVFFRFGLIVTGEGERDHLDKLFRPLMATRICNFKVIKFIGQLRPITSTVRKQKMVGTGKIIPTRDEEQVGLPARGYLDDNHCRFVIVIDDLEGAWRSQSREVFERYRLALDTMLSTEQRARAAVHLLVNMLEAYYFADASAINTALGLSPPLQDYPGDVEEIPHPKARLKELYPNFREVRDGGAILEQLDVERVLSRADTCAWLRTLFAWCAQVLALYQGGPLISPERFRLADGVMSDVTRTQLSGL